MDAQKLTARDREMLEKLEKMKRNPEKYFAEARKVAYRDEMRKALRPWSSGLRRTVA